MPAEAAAALAGRAARLRSALDTNRFLEQDHVASVEAPAAYGRLEVAPRLPRPATAQSLCHLADESRDLGVGRVARQAEDQGNGVTAFALS